jgi:hypothetical protein
VLQYNKVFPTEPHWTFACFLPISSPKVCVCSQGPILDWLGQKPGSRVWVRWLLTAQGMENKPTVGLSCTQRGPVQPVDDQVGLLSSSGYIWFYTYHSTVYKNFESIFTSQ